MVDIQDILFPELVHFLSTQQNICKEIYLVGGAIRNAYLKKKIHDIDFVVGTKPVEIAKNLSDHFDGGFYVLDRKRGTARSLITVHNQKLRIDFACFNGKSIDEDLRKRDFTINAMALRIPDCGDLIDPLGGIADLKSSILRPCSLSAFRDDPVRTIRAVRFIFELDLKIDRKDVEKIQQAASFLDTISGERIRDEFLNVMSNSDGTKAVQRMMNYAILARVLPEITGLIGLDLSPPHTHNGWAHTLQVLAYCQQLLSLFNLISPPDSFHPLIKMVAEVFHKYNDHLNEFFNKKLNAERDISSLLFLAALYHDSGKGRITPVKDHERMRFPKHAKVGSKLIQSRMKAMGFSKVEVNYAVNTVRYHMKPSEEEFANQDTRNLQIHRFFRKTGPAGILIGFLHLADVLATYEENISDKRWERAVTSINNIFNAYFLQYKNIISPEIILDGEDIMKEFNLRSGKKVGKLLNRVAEAQVEGKIQSKNEAFEYLHNSLNVNPPVVE